MINVSTITAQIVDWFKDDPNFETWEITRSEFANESPGAAANGWMGIYRRSVDYDPTNLGVPPNNYHGRLIFDILLQKTHYGSGADAEDALEEAVKNALDRLVQLPRDYVDTFTDLSVEYAYVETDRKTMYFQGALITATAEVSFEVS